MRVKNMLRAKGRPMPENDLWVAAIARQYNLILVARNNHFSDIASLLTVCRQLNLF
jgi:tRNA(fMet)-specific endonuclease VapC